MLGVGWGLGDENYMNKLLANRSKNLFLFSFVSFFLRKWRKKIKYFKETRGKMKIKENIL